MTGYGSRAFSGAAKNREPSAAGVLIYLRSPSLELIYQRLKLFFILTDPSQFACSSSEALISYMG